ncbi:MAG: TetR/AcrR family transcriptional regulator [Candidatus Thiodiazotropha sp.]|jgi:TetR/AcrR family transcriptional regulator, mexJK operon transcriptional repressor
MPNRSDRSILGRTGRPKSEAKAEAILNAATKLFLAKGFQGTSMDAVAREAGVSKQTVYSHFANKETLFVACIDAKVAHYGFDEAAGVDDSDLRQALLTIVHRFTDLLFDSEVVAVYRVVLSESTGQPQLASLFFDNGPKRTKSAICEFLRQQVAKGRLRIPKERLLYATVQLLNMSVGIFQWSLLFGLQDSVDDSELAAHLERAVDDFLTLYAV